MRLERVDVRGGGGYLTIVIVLIFMTFKDVRIYLGVNYNYKKKNDKKPCNHHGINNLAF